MKWTDLLWGRPTFVIATVCLMLFGLRGNPDWQWAWIPVIASFAILHSIVNWLRERSISAGIGRNYEFLQRRVLRLIANLSELTASKFDLWMVDLYVPRRRIGWSTRPPFVPKKKFVRELTSALTDDRVLPSEIELNHVFFGACFANVQPGIWWDDRLVKLPIEKDNRWHDMDKKVNEELGALFGVVGVNPIVDGLGKQCRGLLIVHTRPDSEVATIAAGALAQSKGGRHLAEACEDIHSYIRK